MKPIWSLPFRPLFLMGAIYSIIALAVWSAFWLQGLNFIPLGGWVWWHSHEMVFGFVTSIVAGFILTAARNWTGQATITGKPLMLLCGLWLAARILILVPFNVPILLIAALDILFLVGVMLTLGRMVLAVKQWRNLGFVPLMLILILCNGASYAGLLQADYMLARWGILSGVFIVIMIITVIAARVIPFFTAGGTQTPKVMPLPWLEQIVLISTLNVVLVQLLSIFWTPSDKLVAVLWLIMGASHSLRLARWYTPKIIGVPLLWPLYVAYGFLVLGCVVFALRALGVSDAGSAALHSVTVGTMGLMILAMITRVSLGHTGRPLMVGKVMHYAFIFMTLAGVVRVLIPMVWPQAPQFWLYQASIVFWMLGYGVFVINFLPKLISPRADGK